MSQQIWIKHLEPLWSRAQGPWSRWSASEWCLGHHGISLLVGGFSPPLWKIMEFVSWDDDYSQYIPNIWKVIKFHGNMIVPNIWPNHQPVENHWTSWKIWIQQAGKCLWHVFCSIQKKLKNARMSSVPAEGNPNGGHSWSFRQGYCCHQPLLS